MRIDNVLYRGSINKEFRLTYMYTFEQDGKYQTVLQKDNGNISIMPSFSISISEGFEKSRMFLPSSKYFQFVLLLKKTVNVISDNLYDIFPNINKIEFEIDSRVLQRFQTEQAMTVCGMTMIPCVWVDSTNTCYPAIRVTSANNESIDIPFEDAMSLSQMLQSFSPHQFGLSLLRIIGKVQ